LLSAAYDTQAEANWRRLPAQREAREDSIALVVAGMASAAKTAMMPMTTSNSIKVNAPGRPTGANADASLADRDAILGLAWLWIPKSIDSE
jgi:hypothetical protein